jgi:cell division protein FtsQ
MTQRPAARRATAARRAAAGQARRTRSIRRASAGLSPVRAGAILAMLVSAGAMYGVGASAAFAYRSLEIEGDRYTSAAAVGELVAVEPGTNLFLVSADDIAERLATLPTIRSVDVSIVLPDTVRVGLVEREPVLVWRVGERSFLVDRGGILFGELAPDRDAALPVILDDRVASRSYAVGTVLEAVDLDAATRLGSIRPDDVGSAASAFTLLVTDENGFVVRAESQGWDAVFGFYTPTLRQAAIIPGQVRLLRSLLIGREHEIGRVILASETDGTYLPRPSPAPSP